MDHSIKSFAKFLNESGDWRDRLRLAQLGLDHGARVLKVQVDWDRLSQPGWDRLLNYVHLHNYMHCWIYENWPGTTERDRDWVEWYSDKMIRSRRKGPVDPRIVDSEIMRLARKFDADLVWKIPDNTWLDARTGEHIGKLHQALGLE